MFRVNLTTVRQGAWTQHFTGYKPDEVADKLAALPIERQVPQGPAEIVASCLPPGQLVRCGTNSIDAVNLRNILGIAGTPAVILIKVYQEGDDIGFEPVRNNRAVR